MPDYLIVLNKDEDSVSFIDAEAGTTRKKIKTDHNPHEVVVTPDGRKTFITCSLGNRLNIIDNEKMEIIKSLEHPDFSFPHGLGLSPTGDELYLASTFSGKIFVIDPAAGEVRNVIPTGQKHSHMIATTPTGDRVFVPNIGSHNVTVLATASQEIVDHFPVGKSPEGIAVHSHSSLLYVASQDEDILFCIDIDSYEVIHRLRLGRCPIRVVFSPDGRYCLIPNRESNDLSVIDTLFPRGSEARPWEIKRIPVGIWPGGTVFNPEGSRAYVANNKTNDIGVIHMETLQEEKRYEAGIHPDGIAFLRG